MRKILALTITVLFSTSSYAAAIVGGVNAIKLEKKQLNHIKSLRKDMGLSDETPLLMLQKGDVWMPAGPANFGRNQVMQPAYFPLESFDSSLHAENVRLKKTIKLQKDIISKLKEAIEVLQK